MKKAFASFGQSFLLAFFLVFGVMLINPTAVSAQQMNIDRLMAQTQNWKSEAEALSVLDAKLIQNANLLGTQTPGTAAYQDTRARLTFHKFIFNKLKEGSSTQASVFYAVEHINDTAASFDAMLPESKVVVLYTDLVGFLTL